MRLDLTVFLIGLLCAPNMQSLEQGSFLIDIDWDKPIEEGDCIDWDEPVEEGDHPNDALEPKAKRFKQVSTPEDIERQASKSVPENTQRKREWALSLLKKWSIHRKNINKPVKNINECSVSELNSLLSHFILEIRKENGEEYPGSTIYEILSCIQATLRDNGIQVSRKRNIVNTSE